MTVTTTTYSIQYDGDGSTTVFAIPFEFIADGDIVAQLTDTNVTPNTTVTWVITTNYSLSGAGNDAGGSLTAVTAPASGERLTIYRDTTATQGTDYPAASAFPEEDHEQALDKLTLLIQEVKGKLARLIGFPESEDRSGGTKNSDLPTPETGKALGWDSDDNLANLALSDLLNSSTVTITSGDAGKVLVINSTEDGFEVGDTKNVSANVAISCGPTGDYGTLNEAVAAAYKCKPLYDVAGIRVTITCENTFTMAEQILVDGLDMSFITISGGTATTVTRSALSATNGAGYPVFGGTNGARLPVINHQFEIDSSGTGTNRNGIGLTNGSWCLVNSGGVGDGYRGIYANQGSEVIAISADFQDATLSPIYADNNSRVYAQGARLDDSGGDGVYANSGSFVDVTSAVFGTISTGAMINCNNSHVIAENATVTSTGANGVDCGGGTVIAGGVDASGATGTGFDVSAGGIIKAAGSTGTLSQTANTIAAAGIIFK